MRRALVAAAAIAVLVLTGCVAPAAVQTKPTVIDTPAILWDVAPTSPLESNKYVQAMRAAEVGWALAINNRDFSILQFTNTVTARGGIDSYDSYMRTVFGLRGGDDPEPFVVLGPSRWVPLTVSPNAGDNGARIEVCYIGMPVLDAEGERGVGESGRVWSFDVTTDVESGLLVAAGMSIATQTECDASLAPVGRFSPVPELPAADELTGSDVIPPPWWEASCFTGWSKAGCNRGEDAR